MIDYLDILRVDNLTKDKSDMLESYAKKISKISKKLNIKIEGVKMKRNKMVKTTYLLFGMILGVSLLVCGCGKNNYKYAQGDMVRVKLDNRCGMVVSRWHYGKYLYYNIRFSCEQQQTQTRILSNDKPILIKPYAIVSMQEFEIKLVDQNIVTNY